MKTWFFWSLLSALFAGLTAVLAKIGVSNVDSNLATAIRTSVVLVLAWALVLANYLRGSLKLTGASLDPRTVWMLVLSGVATGLSWLCYFRALQMGEASRVAPVDKLSVLFAIAFAAVWLREPIGWQHWLGGSLILAGAVVLAWRH